MNDYNFDEIVKNQEETAYKELKQPVRSQRDKLRALRDEFGFQPTQPQKEESNNE